MSGWGIGDTLSSYSIMAVPSGKWCIQQTRSNQSIPVSAKLPNRDHSRMKMRWTNSCICASRNSIKNGPTGLCQIGHWSVISSLSILLDNKNVVRHHNCVVVKRKTVGFSPRDVHSIPYPDITVNVFMTACSPWHDPWHDSMFPLACSPFSEGIKYMLDER